ncbi:MAG: hypothetical protein H6732_01140 [Alphaproteobacteria bacterium]|nr:hypothetical protein [Alphaproteobacteria bacterium]
MLAFIGWLLALAGLLAGLLLAFVPGVPGALVALLGLAAYALLGWGAPVGWGPLGVATLFAVAGTAAQAFAPLAGVRAVSAASGAASGAALGGVLGVLVPVPLVQLLPGTVGALGGTVVGGGRLLSRLAVPLAIVPLLGAVVLVDLLAVLGIGAVLAVAGHLAA